MCNHSLLKVDPQQIILQPAQRQFAFGVDAPDRANSMSRDRIDENLRTKLGKSRTKQDLWYRMRLVVEPRRLVLAGVSGAIFFRYAPEICIQRLASPLLIRAN